MRRSLIWIVFAALASSWLILAQGASGTTVALGEAEGLGTFLTDGEGRSLYLFTDDEGGASACYDPCAANWPPLTVEGEPTAGQGVAASLLGTVERTDGTLQVTYNGLPLYRFARDEAPGDTLGQGANGVWFLVSPYGGAVASPAPEEETADDGGAVDDMDPMLRAELMAEGRTVFAETCSVCHGRNGEGGAGPSLAAADLGDTTRVARQILRGSSHMPGFGNQLSDRQVAAVATFIRNSWGHGFGSVSEEEVGEER